jgi:hypothetical protein
LNSDTAALEIGPTSSVIRLPLLLFLVFSGVFTAKATAYHFDALLGDDGADGSSSRPFRTISRANRLRLKPGDELRFRTGQEFPGNLLLDEHDAGTSEAPVMIASTGNGVARILAGAGCGIRIRNAAGIEIRDLEISGAAANRNIGSGIRFENDTAQALRHVRIRDVSCHDFGGVPVVTLNPAGKSHHYDFGQGIALCAIRPVHPRNPSTEPNSTVPVRGFADVVIQDCRVSGCQGYGIHFDGPDPTDENAYAHSDVRVTRCWTHDNPGDGDYFNNHSGSGILLSSVAGGRVESCRAWENGRECKAYTGGPCGIWAANSTRIVFQQCESFRNRTGSLDGAGFDLDGGVTDSVIEQCYSHENDGAGFLLYSYPGAPLRFAKNICRFNLSVGDNRRGSYAGIYAGAHGGRWEGLLILQNTVITDVTNLESAAMGLITEGNPGDIRIHHNLFVARGGLPAFRGGRLPGLKLQGNAWWSETGAPRFVCDGREFDGLTAWRSAVERATVDGPTEDLELDPHLDLDGVIPTTSSGNDPSTFGRYRPAADSPLTLHLRSRRLPPATLPLEVRDFFNHSPAEGAPWLPGADAFPRIHGSVNAP